MTESYVKNIKEILFAFILFLVSCFFFKIDAHALTTVSFPAWPSQFVTTKDYHFQSKVDELIQELDKTNKFYIVTLQYFADYDAYGANQNSINVRLFDTIPSFKFFSSSIQGSHSTDQYQYYEIYASMTDMYLQEAELDKIINIVKQKKWGTRNATFNIYDNEHLVYYANFDITNQSDTYVYDINSNLINKNEKMPYARDRQLYVENFRTDAKNIDRVEYNFEIPKQQMFSFLFNFSVSWSSASVNKDLFISPYLSVETDSASDLLPLNEHLVENENELLYYDTQINVFRENTTAIKFIVSFTNINAFDDSSVFIHFDSDYPFTRTIIENSSPVDPPDPPSDSTQTIIDQNQTIIDQNKEMNDYLKDDSPPNADISSLGNVQGLLPPGPLDSLLNIPAQFLSVSISSLGGQCKDLSGTWVFDQPFTYPCFDKIIWNDFEDHTLMNYLQLIPCAFILIYYFKHLYKKVDRATSMNSNSDDEWGVI